MLSLNNLITRVRTLCTPSYLYLVLSLISLTLIFIQNIGNTNTYCVGNYGCEVNTASVFAGKILYIAFWTFVLNRICKAGYTSVSWFLLFLPFLSLFILLGMLILHKGVQVL